MKKLRPYLDHGFLEADSHSAERAMRCVALGKKKFLFVGSKGGGKLAAIAYTLIETAKLNGTDPRAWLTRVLGRIADQKITRLQELTPWSQAAPVSSVAIRSAFVWRSLCYPFHWGDREEAMSELKFEGETMHRLERLYHSRDVTSRRAATIELLALRAGEKVLDIGSGPGFLAEEMADEVGPTGEVRGVDISQQLVDRATDRNRRHWLSYTVGDAASHWEASESYHVVVSVQVAEYVANLAGFCAGFHRAMKPGGRGLIITTDWGTVAWNSDKPGRMERMLGIWSRHCADPHLPRHLIPNLLRTGLKIERVSTHPQLNLDWSDHTYSKHLAGFVREHAKASGMVPDEEIAAWHDELPALAGEGRYFFALSSFNFLVSRPN